MIVGDSLLCRKIAVALCGFYFVYLDRKSGAEICSPTPLYCSFYFCVLFYFSAPLSRLSPNEALPHTPQGLCPLTPQALWRRAPACVLSLATLGVGGTTLVSYAHSSLLTPHLLRHCFFHFLYKLSEHCKCLIDRLSCCHIYTCTLKQ